MDSTRHTVSRRGLLVAAAAGSAVAMVPTSALAAGVPAAPLVHRDRIATAVTRLPDGRAATLAYTLDLHDRLGEWLRFWWANAPGTWRAPLEVVGETAAAGQAYLLTEVRYTTADRLVTGFAAAVRNPAYWATLASLHRFFPEVTSESGRIRVVDGAPGYTGTPSQLAFVRGAQQQIWGGRPAGDVSSRSGWQAFTKATLRLGLDTEPFLT